MGRMLGYGHPTTMFLFVFVLDVIVSTIVVITFSPL